MGTTVGGSVVEVVVVVLVVGVAVVVGASVLVGGIVVVGGADVDAEVVSGAAAAPSPPPLPLPLDIADEQPTMATVPNTTPNAIFALARELTCMGRKCNGVEGADNSTLWRVPQPFSNPRGAAIRYSAQVGGENLTAGDPCGIESAEQFGEGDILSRCGHSE